MLVIARKGENGGLDTGIAIPDRPYADALERADEKDWANH